MNNEMNQSAYIKYLEGEVERLNALCKYTNRRWASYYRSLIPNLHHVSFIKMLLVYVLGLFTGILLGGLV